MKEGWYRNSRQEAAVKGLLEEKGCMWGWGGSVYVQAILQIVGKLILSVLCLLKTCLFMSELCSANLMCSFHDRRLNSTQGEIRVGPSHQVKWILVTSLIGFYFLLFNWSFILLSSNLELFLCYLEFYINAEIYFLKTTAYFKKIMVKYIQSKINHSDHFKANGSVPISTFTSLCRQSPEPIQLPNLKLGSH